MENKNNIDGGTKDADKNRRGAASDAAGKREIISLPRRSELLYILPLALSAAFTIWSMNGGASDEDIGRTGNFLLCMLMMIEMAAMMFVHLKLPDIVGYVVAIGVPPCVMLLLEYTSHDPFADMTGIIVWLNIAFFYILALIGLAVFRRTSTAVLIPTVYALIAGLAEHYLLLFRSAPLFPWDLKSIGIAADVAGNYDFTPDSSLAASVTAFCFIISLGFYTCAKIEPMRKLAVRIPACVIAAALLFGYSFYLGTDKAISDFGLYPYLFTPTTLYYRNGFSASFLMNMRYLSIDKPRGYSNGKIEEIASADHSAAYEPYSDVENPNIVVIMDEAFSDLSVFCDFETNQDYMPFIHSMDENTVKGTLHVSVLGGNTANTEFEFLTGLSMAFLPTGSIPYQQYLKAERPSLASHLGSLGYKTLAIHPYGASGWNRNTVYPSLGFDEALFRNDLTGMSIIRRYVSDASVFRRILTELRTKETDDPMFIFNVTMQNHGAYTQRYDSFGDRAVTATGLEDDQKLSQYLSLIKKTDSAVEMMLTQLQSFDEPTVVVFFGDHQPGDWVSTALRNMYGVHIDDANVTERETYYEVPFFIWANYDIREENVGAISANYLSTLLCQVANVELTDAQRFLADLRSVYPTVSANSYMTADGALHPIADATKNELLNQYAILQYNYLFDDNTSGMFD